MARTLLIVDDVETNRIILKKILGEDYDILEAADGLEAMEKMESHYRDISAVLLDLAMPIMDGFEVLSQMRASDVLSQLPVIVTTGQTDDSYEVKALQLGANDYISKPYNSTIIKQRIHNTINLRESSAAVNELQRDHLTGLLNRNAFFQKAEEMIGRADAGYYVISCFDIDSFKVINDQYGTETGDRVLKYVASTIDSYVASVGGICGRMMADNFALLISRESLDTGDILKYHEKAANPPGLGQPVTIRIGRYVVDDLSLSVSGMYDRAALAEQTVKGKYGQYIAVFSDDLRSSLLREQAIVSEMDAALSSGQFVPWFQPQYNHATGALVGAEALVRWKKPDGTLIPPNDFIPVFERNGFIYEMDKSVWEQTCALLRKWLDEGRNPLPVSVNISRCDLFRSDMHAFLASLVEKYSIPKDLLRLEVTESAFAEQPEQVTAAVKKLIDMGFTVEIDDFGSGYSSLNTLKDVPADILKLDMKFMSATGDTQRGGNIIESVVRMAKWIGMAVIAEGVESIDQADFLKSIGCVYIQGYLYAKPMPAEEYEALAPQMTKERELITLETVENLDNNSFWAPESMDTLIFNSYVGGSCIYEYTNGKIELLRANDKYSQVIGSAGMTIADALALDWTEHLDKETLARVREDLEKSIETRDEITGEYIFLDLPGCPHKTYLRSTMRVIASAGERYLVYCTNENITAQRQAERKERLAEAERLKSAEQLQAIMDNINGGVTAMVIKNGHSRFLFSNDRYYDLLGYSRQEYNAQFSGKYNCIHPKDRDRVKEQALRASIQRKSYSAEYRVIRKDGEVRWVRSNVTIMAFPGVLEPVQLAVATDITEERLAQQKERETASKLQAILDNVGRGITATVKPVGKTATLLFSNDKFYEIVGYPRSYFAAASHDLYSIVHPEDREKIRQTLESATKARKTISLEYRVIRPDQSLIWVKTAFTVASFLDSDEPVQLAIFSDVTAEKKAAQVLRETDEQLKFLNDMAHDLLAYPDSDEGTNHALNQLLDYFGGDRAYIFEYDFSDDTARNSYEVCAEGVDSAKDYLQSVPLSAMPFWLESFRNKDFIHIRDVDGLPESRSVERETLAAQGIKTLFAVPLFRDGALIGFIGVDNPHKQLGDIARLAALGDYIAVMLTRRDLAAKIQSDNKTLLALMNDTPGGFVRMQVLPDGSIIPDYINEGFCKLVNMDVPELMDIYKNDALAGLLPEDAEIVSTAVKKMLTEGEAYSEKYRLPQGGGGYKWLMFFGRKTVSETGEVFLNVYYTDATAQHEAEELQKSLLDNLPCGAALFEFDNNSVTVKHMNKRLLELSGRSALSENTAFAAVHPEDTDALRQELKNALVLDRPIACDLRIRTDDGAYRPFHIVGRIAEKHGGAATACITYTPISAEEMSYREMIPVVLSTVMKSSSDLSFAKDRDLRYICSSRAFANMVGLNNENEVVGKTDYDLFDNETAEKYRSDDKKLLDSGESIIDMVEEIPSEDGIPRYSSTSKYLLLDSASNVLGLYGVGRDITEYRSAFDKLKLLTESIPGGLATFICSPDGIKLTYFNDGFCALFGRAREEFAEIANENPMGLVLEEDREELKRQLAELVENGTPIDCVYRADFKNNAFRWINHKAMAADRKGDTVTVNAVLTDVTEQQEYAEKLRVSEEENRLAMSLNGNIVCRYTIETRTVTMSPEVAAVFACPETVADVPYTPVHQGRVSPETQGAYLEFFERIIHGAPSGTGVFQCRTAVGWRWLEGRFSTIYSDVGKPLSAVVAYQDVTEQLEKETVYKKWQQSLEDKPEDSYTLFRCNLNRNTSFDTAEGRLLNVAFGDDSVTFNDRTSDYISQCVYPEDANAYAALLNSDALLAGYYRGNRTHKLEYREKLPEGGERWICLTIDLVEYPQSSEIEAYLMYEDIDEKKREALRTIEMAESDPLTGVLNRTAFAAGVEHIISTSPPAMQHALLMLDIDGFKLVNDFFGHGAGDQALTDVADSLATCLRRGDLLGRLGGDEFLIFLTDIPSETVASNKAKQICALTRKSFSPEVEISGSVGIVLSPRDGRDFDTLYKKADSALYYVKGTGRDSFSFYCDDMEEPGVSVPVMTEEEPLNLRQVKRKRHMLIVDDNMMDYTVMANIFRDDFTVDRAVDGSSALIRLRHYGSAISVVLLDLMMPGVDGFAVLERMRSINELRSIPVVVVSGSGDRETSLKAIRSGAADYVSKPIDPDLLRIRVSSAVSRAENEKLRAQNSVLSLENAEVTRYKAVLERSGVVVVEQDWISGSFTYDRSISKMLFGTYDSRRLWHIFLSDMVADTATVKQMQELVQTLAEGGGRSDAVLTVKLKTPARQYHWFRVNIFRLINEFGLTDRILITFFDLGAEKPDGIEEE